MKGEKNNKVENKKESTNSRNTTHFKKNRLILVIVVAIVVILAIVFMVKNNTLSKKDKTNVSNYEIMADGSKVNVNDNVSADKVVGNLKIEKTSITCKDGVSKVVSKVTNSGDDIANLSLIIKFIGPDGKEIQTPIETVGFIGSIKKGEEKYIDSSLTQDVTDITNVVYEIKNK